MRLSALLLAGISIMPVQAVARGNNAAAVVRFTPFGVAHISASSMKGAGKGYGWAFARDNLCANIEQAVRLAGERSRHFDPAATTVNLFAGGAITNADSDAAALYLLPDAQVKRLKARSSADMRGLVTGFVAGFNAHASGNTLPGETCRNAPWFPPAAGG
jgi:acyl-homoserine-lactone acylase